MINFSNKNEEDSLMDLKENEYYWLYFRENFSLIKVLNVIDKEILYYDCEVFLDDKTKIRIEDFTEEKKMNLKDKSNLSHFDLKQLNPVSDDLAQIQNISYPSILYNFKLKNQIGLYFTKAGKLLIGINYSKIKEEYEEDIQKILLQFLFSNNNSNDQSIIVNGLPNTGKSNLVKTIIEDILIKSDENNNNFNSYKSFNTNNNSSNNLNTFLLLNDCFNFLEIFGNAIENKNNLNSSRYMRLIKLSKIKNSNKLIKIKIKHFLFEKSRILENFTNSKNPKMNFHIFHSIMEGFYTIFLKEVYNTHEEFNEIIQVIKSEYSSLHENGMIEFLYKEYNIHNKSDNQFKNFYLDKFYLLLRLLKRLNLSHKKLIKKIFNILLTILLLAKLEFSSDEEGKATLEENNIFIQLVSNLLDCDINILRTKFISREIKSPRGSFYVVTFSLDQAIRTRDTFLKYLYDNLFEYLTKFINVELNREIRKESLGMNNTSPESDEEYQKFIKNLKLENLIKSMTIVECFGFENFEDRTKNSLDNLYINYTNDKFNNLLFDILIKGETELYKDEGIIEKDFDILKNKNDEKNEEKKENLISNKSSSNTVTTTSTRRSVTSSSRPTRLSVIKMKNNKSNGFLDVDIENTLQACDDNSKGIFKLLDVQGTLINMNNGSTKPLIDNIKLSWPQISTTNDSFFLSHFGSVVEYGASDFVIKNVDSVNEELREISKKFFKQFTKYVISVHSFSKDQIGSYLLKSFKDDLIQNYNNSSTNKDSQTLGRNSAIRRVSQNIKLKSNSDKFLNQVKKLLNKITKTSIKFIKLINTNKLDDLSCDDKFILQQIYSSGIYESILLAKGGYFIRHNYEELLKRLSKFSIFSDYEDKNEIVKILSQILGIDSNQIIVGKSVLFIKNNAVDKNKLLNTCTDLPSFVINSMLKKLFSKFMSTFKLVKFFSSIGKKGRLRFLLSILQDILNHKKLKFFIDLLKNNLDDVTLKTNLIQNRFRQFIKRKKTFSFVDVVNKKLEKLLLKKFYINLKLFEEIKIESCAKIQNLFTVFRMKNKIKKLKIVKQFNSNLEIVYDHFNYRTFMKNFIDLIELKNKNANVIKNSYHIFQNKIKLKKFKNTDKLFNSLQKIFKNINTLKFLKLLDEISKNKIISANIIRNNFITYIAKKNLKFKSRVIKLSSEIDRILLFNGTKYFISILRYNNEKYKLIKNLCTIYSTVSNKSKLKYFFKYLVFNKNLQNKNAKIIQRNFLNYKKSKKNKTGLNQLVKFITKKNKINYLSILKLYALNRNESVIKIQTYFKTYTSQKQVKKLIKTKKLNQTILNIINNVQKRRAITELEYAYNNFMNKLHSIILIKKYFNKYLLKKKEKLKNLIKLIFKLFSYRLKREGFDEMNKANENYKNKLHAVILIKNSYSKFKLLKKEKFKNFAKKVNDITNLKLKSNGFLTLNSSYKYLINKIKSVILIKKYFNLYKLEKKEKFKNFAKKVNDITNFKLKSNGFFTLHYYYKNLIYKIKSVILIKKYFNLYKLEKKEKLKALLKKLCIISSSKLKRQGLDEMKNAYQNFNLKLKSSELIKMKYREYKFKNKIKQEKFINIIQNNLNKCSQREEFNKFVNLYSDLKNKIRSINLIKIQINRFKIKKRIKLEKLVEKINNFFFNSLKREGLNTMINFHNNLKEKINSVGLIKKFYKKFKIRQRHKFEELIEIIQKKTLIMNKRQGFDRLKNCHYDLLEKLKSIILIKIKFKKYKFLKQIKIKNLIEKLQITFNTASKRKGFKELHKVYNIFKNKIRFVTLIKRKHEENKKNKLQIKFICLIDILRTIENNLNKKNGFNKLLNCYVDNKNKIKSTNLIQKHFSEFKYEKQMKLEKLKEFSNTLSNIFNKNIKHYLLTKIKNKSDNKLNSVLSIQNYYRKFKSNKKNKIETLTNILNKSIFQNYQKLFIYDLYSSYITYKLDNILNSKYDHVNLYYSNELFTKLKIISVKKKNYLNKIILLQKVVKNYLSNKKEITIENNLIFKNLFSRFAIKTYLKDFNNKFKKFQKLQKIIKCFLINFNISKEKSNDEIKRLALEYQVKKMIREIKDSAIFHTSMKTNIDRIEKTDDIFTLSFTQMEIIDDYVEERELSSQLEKEELNLSEIKQNTLEENLLVIENEKNEERQIENVNPININKPISVNKNSCKIIPKITKSSNKPIVLKNSIPNYNIKPNSSRNASINKNVNNKVKSVSLEIDVSKKLEDKKKNISIMRNVTKKLHNEFNKNKNNDKLLSQYANELDDLMKDIRKDLNTIKMDELGTDFKKLNKDKKKMSSIKINENLTTGVSSHKDCGHNHGHESINISENYENVSFKRICLSGQLKKI